MTRVAGRWAAIVLILVASGGCSATIAPALRQDAQAAVRVKTALVNDPDLGAYPIAVRVDGGVVELSGEVTSEAEIAAVVSLVRQVPGVSDVRPMLRVRTVPAEATAPPATVAPPSFLRPRDEEPIERSTDRRLLAIGASVRWSNPPGGDLGGTLSVGPNVRLGMGTGAGVSIGFGWFETDLYGSGGSSDPLARLRIRPVMAGLGYTFRRDAVGLSLSLVGGVALNSLTLPERVDVTEAALAIGHSFAWRPGVSLWIDANDRLAFNVSTGYLVTRPTVTVLENGETRTRPLRADTVLISAGAVYKIF